MLASLLLTIEVLVEEEVDNQELLLELVVMASLLLDIKTIL